MIQYKQSLFCTYSDHINNGIYPPFFLFDPKFNSQIMPSTVPCNITDLITIAMGVFIFGIYIIFSP